MAKTHADEISSDDDIFEQPEHGYTQLWVGMAIGSAIGVLITLGVLYLIYHH